MNSMALWVKCEAEGCSSLFVPSKGKRYCSGACRAKASDEAQFRRRLAHKQVEMTPERRALRMAGQWLGERI